MSLSDEQWYDLLSARRRLHMDWRRRWDDTCELLSDERKYQILSACKRGTIEGLDLQSEEVTELRYKCWRPVSRIGALFHKTFVHEQQRYRLTTSALELSKAHDLSQNTFDIVQHRMKKRWKLSTPDLQYEEIHNKVFDRFAQATPVQFLRALDRVDHCVHIPTGENEPIDELPQIYKYIDKIFDWPILKNTRIITPEQTIEASNTHHPAFPL